MVFKTNKKKNKNLFTVTIRQLIQFRTVFLRLWIHSIVSACPHATINTSLAAGNAGIFWSDNLDANTQGDGIHSRFDQKSDAVIWECLAAAEPSVFLRVWWVSNRLMVRWTCVCVCVSSFVVVVCLRINHGDLCWSCVTVFWGLCSRFWRKRLSFRRRNS